MRADYDSQANAISIALAPVEHADRADQVHGRAIVALHDGHPVELQLLYPDMGIEEPLAAAADRYGLDRGALEAAARSALAVPDRVVVLDGPRARRLISGPAPVTHVGRHPLGRMRELAHAA